MLESIKSPEGLRGLSYEELDSLSDEIRQFLITKVSKTGGHLGPNLGVVELTLAIHRTFNSPKDVVLFDTGHQSYVHKMITGRVDQFAAGCVVGRFERIHARRAVLEQERNHRRCAHRRGAVHLVVPQHGVPVVTDVRQVEELVGLHVLAKRLVVVMRCRVP